MHVRQATCMLQDPTCMLHSQHACCTDHIHVRQATCMLVVDALTAPRTLPAAHHSPAARNAHLYIFVGPIVALGLFHDNCVHCFQAVLFRFLGIHRPGFGGPPSTRCGRFRGRHVAPVRPQARNRFLLALHKSQIHCASIHSLAPRRVAAVARLYAVAPWHAFRTACGAAPRPGRPHTSRGLSPTRTPRGHRRTPIAAPHGSGPRCPPRHEGPGAPRPPHTSRGLAGRQSGARHAPARHRAGRAARRVRGPTRQGRRTYRGTVAGGSSGERGNRIPNPRILPRLQCGLSNMQIVI